MEELLVHAKMRKPLAILLTCTFCWAYTFLAINIFRNYAFGLFIYLPIVLGASSTILYGYKNPVAKTELRTSAFITLAIYCLGLLAFAFEGIICLIMAAPIGIFFTWLGYLVGFEIINNKSLKNPQLTVILLLVCGPAIMAFEYTHKPAEQMRQVITAIEINASPSTVWKNVVEFPSLSEPNEFIFKTGIAFPISATISGNGVGAIRHCNFSTGSFIEPITVWDEARLLRFDVLDQPEPLKELSPYSIHPNHLHGYWISKQGQFKLTQLPNGHTLLEGTTWYINKIEPNFYWAVFSDYIVHAIHQRVLQHIKIQSEKAMSKN